MFHDITPTRDRGLWGGADGELCTFGIDARSNSSIRPSSCAFNVVNWQDHEHHHDQGRHAIFYKDWGTASRSCSPRLAAERGRLGRPDAVLPRQGYRVDRPRPPGTRPLEPDSTATTWTLRRRRSRRSSSTSTCRDAIHVGHSTGGGEVARYVARHGSGRVAKAVLIGAVPPLMVKTAANPGGVPHRGVRRLPRGSWRPTARSSTWTSPRPVLRLQPARREGLAGRHPKLVAAGNDGRRQGPLRLHQGVLGDRLHRGPEDDRRPDPGDARRRRPDRPDRRFRASCPSSSSRTAR